MNNTEQVLSTITQILNQTVQRVVQSEERTSQIQEQLDILTRSQIDVVETQHSMLESIGILGETQNNLAQMFSQFLEQAEADRAVVREMQSQIREMQSEIRGIQTENRRMMQRFFGEEDNPPTPN